MPTPPVVISGPGVVVDRCSLYSKDYARFNAAAGWNYNDYQFGLVYCTTISYPSQPIVVTRGNWDVRIPVTYLGDLETGSLSGPPQNIPYPWGQTHTTVSVTATITDIGANPVATWQPSNASSNPNCSFSSVLATPMPGVAPTSANGSIVLYDVDAPDAPSNAKATGQQDSGTGASGILHVPVAADWARSEITYVITVTQSLPNTNAPEQTGNEDPGCSGTICPITDFWSNTSQFNSTSTPNMNAVVSCGINCTCQNPQNSVVYIEPPGLLQLNVLPLTIVYSPLGSQGKSSFTLGTQTGTNVQFGQSSQTVNSTTTDDKEALNGGITIAGFTVGGSGTWDNSVLSQQSATAGLTVSIANTTSIGLTTTVSWPSSWPPLSSATYGTQPFWNDLFLLAVNPQLAVWDYPSGAIVEPLGSATLVSVYVQQLYQCSQQPNGAVTHFSAPTAGSTSNSQLSLTNAQCLALLQLDPFWVTDTQNAMPYAYRTILPISVSGSTSESATETTSTTLTVTNNQNSSFTSTVTSTQTNSFNDGLSENYQQLIGVNLGGSTGGGSTTQSSLIAAYTSQSGSALQNSVTTSNQVSEPKNTQNFGVVFYQDAYLGGIAIQDQGMSFPHCRLNPMACAMAKPCSGLCLRPCPTEFCGRLPGLKLPSTLQAARPDFNRHFARPLRRPNAISPSFEPLSRVLPLYTKASMSPAALSELDTVSSHPIDVRKVRPVNNPPPPPRRRYPRK